MLLFTTVLLGCVGTLALGQSQQDLQHLQVIFRHGDRSPLHKFAGDLYANYTWPMEKGVLTPQGKTRAFELGEHLRDRYADYLHSVPSSKVSAKSSIVHRCLESTQLVLAGMFPPTQADVWSKRHSLAMMWQPFPIESRENDPVLTSPNSCQLGLLLMLKSMNSAPVKKYLADHQEFIEGVCKAAQVPTSPVSFIEVIDTIICQKSFFGLDFQYPAWMNETTFTEARQILKYATSFMNLQEPAIRDRFSRVRAGPFIGVVLKSLAKQKKRPTDHRVELFGSHDTKLIEILTAFDLHAEYPGFSDAIAIEMWAAPTKGEEPHIKMFYINSTNAYETTQLRFNESSRFKAYCLDDSCPLSGFQTALKPLVPEDLEKECEYSMENLTNYLL